MEVATEAHVLVDAEHVGHDAHVLRGGQTRVQRPARGEDHLSAVQVELLRLVRGRRAAPNPTYDLNRQFIEYRD